MKPAITLTTANAHDIPVLCDLLALLFSQEAEFQPDRSAQERGLREIMSNPASGRILVARAENQVVAMLNLLFSLSTVLGGRVAWLEDMIVLPDWRRQGIGSALLKEGLSSCRKQDCKRISLLTDTDNLAAQAFYRQHGFFMSTMSTMRCLL